MWQFTEGALLYSASTFISYALAYRTWKMRPARGATIVSLLMLSTGTWALGYLLGFFNTDLAWKIAVLRLEYLGIMGSAFFFALFSISYSYYERWLNYITVILLAVIPVVIYILVLTIPYHDLFYRSYSLVTTEDGFVLLKKVYGPMFWVQSGYNYLTVFLGAALLIQTIIRFPTLFRGQIAILVLAPLILIVSNLLYLTGLNPISPYDPSSISFTITGFLVALSMKRYRFLDIVPVAHDLVFKDINSGVIVLNKKARILEANPAAARMLDQALDAILGKTVFEVFAEHQDLLPHFQDVMEVKTEVTMSEKMYELQIAPLHDRAGAISGHVIMLHDITQRRQTETALREAHDQMATLRQIEAELNQKLSVEYVLTMAMDAAMRLSLADAGFIGLVKDDKVKLMHLFGHYPSEVANAPISKDEGITGRVMRQKRAELVTDVSADPDYKDWIPGTRAQIVIPLTSQDRFIGILNLETSKPEYFTKDLFEALKLLTARTAVAVDNARMYEERERLVEELNAFARTVAHDLKNPLGGVIGYAEILVDKFDTMPRDRTLRSLQAVERMGHKMNDIIESLLLLAGVRTMEEVQISRLDMAHIVEEVRQRLAYMIEEHQAEVILPDTWPAAMGYAPWVEEVWTNYLSNALKYGGTPPRVELGATLESKSAVRFWVRDNGAGLRLEDQTKLFTPFVRVGETNVEGHGLGLSIVRRIVEKLGGEVSVKSAVGEGSVFSFTLPAADATD